MPISNIRAEAEAEAGATGIIPAMPFAALDVDGAYITGDPGEAVAGLLPEVAREKYLTLREEAADTNLLARSAGETANELVRQRIEAQTRVQQLTQPGYGVQFGEDHPEVKRAQARVDALTERLERAAEKRDALQLRWQMKAQLLQQNVGPWLMQVARSGISITAYEGPAPTLKKGETIAAAAERARQDVLRLKADLHELRSRPITAAMAKAKLREQVNKLAEAGRPDVFKLVEFGEPVNFSKIALDMAAGSGVRGQTVDALSTFAWLLRDQLVAALEAEIDRLDSGGGISDLDRAEREAVLLDKLLGAERVECALVDMSDGVIEPRCDVDPRAWLCIDGPAPATD